jgi:hypothetical protein
VTASHVWLTLDVVVALALAGALAVGCFRFVRFCLDDLDHAVVVQGLPRETWRLLIMITIPVGGLLYLAVGRPR